MADEVPTNQPPPPVKRSIRKPLLLVGCGVILAGLLLVVVMNLDQGRPSAPEIDQPPEVVQIIEPGRLTEDEQRAERPSELRAAELGSLSGGWIQVADERGELAQQYRFERLDPDPEGMGSGWFRMTAPVLEIYAADGAVFTLRGDSALTYAPNQAIESGTLTGNVLIHRYEQIVGETLDPSRDEPSMILRTTEARFDNILGEVRCDEEIHVETTSGEFKGRQLKLLINDREDIIELARVEELQYIRLASKRDGAAGAPEGEGGASSDDAGVRRTPTRAAPRERAGDTPAAADLPPAEATDALAEARFYRLTLHDDVQIVQGRGESARRVRGDSLSIIFTMKSEGLGVMLGGAAAPPGEAAFIAAHDASSVSGPRTIEAMIYSAALASLEQAPPSLAPAPRDDDTIITCTGGLTMVPVTDPGHRLPSPRHARLELVGDPVTVSDGGAAAEATCGLLQYHLPAGRLELIASDEHPLQIRSPQLAAAADRFWLLEAEHTAGFSGPGEATFIEADGRDQSDTPMGDDLPAGRREVSWSRRVDLAFDEADQRGMFSTIRHATFIGEVTARSSDFSLADLRGAGVERTPSRPHRTGRLRCEELSIDFLAGADEQVVARRMLALGNVAVTDEAQSLWAQSLDVYFSQPPAPGQAAPTAVRGTQLDRLIAERDVQLLLSQGRRVFADVLLIDGGQRTAVVEGSDVRLAEGSNVIDRARRITIDEQARRYVLEGKGRYRRFDGPLFEEGAGRIEAALFDHVPGRQEELRITWRDGVTVAPMEEEDPPADRAEGSVSVARFVGDVQVVSPEMKLTHADEMAVRFIEGEAGGSTIDAIDALGSVRAHSVGEEGEIACDRLHVDIAQTDEGQAVPRRLEAVGGIRLADANQKMWAESLVATFRPVEEDEPTPPAARRGEFADARVALDTVIAEGDVQVRPAGGERVFADRLVAEAIAETAELFGRRVLVVGEEFVLDRCTHLRLDRQSGEYQVQGPGEFYAFAEPIRLPEVDGRIEPPSLEGAKSIEARWTESALYVESADGGGSLELRGGVHAESRPTALELNRADADILTLDFAEAAGPDRRRELARLLARGQARLENRTWLQTDHGDRPRVFHVGGRHIDYDQRTLEASVIGDGELLIVDDRADEAAPAGQTADAFATKGTTLFRWQKMLHMTQKLEELFDIEMTGNVECLHESIDGRTTTLTGQQLIAGVARGSAGPAQDPQRQDGSLNFGGRMDVRRLYGSGSLYIRTPERDVACDLFDYNTTTGLAELAADPGRTVSVLTRGAARPYRAQRVLWNMIEDRITITRGAGAGAP